MRHVSFILAVLLFACSNAHALELDLKASQWSQIKGKHFTIFYPSSEEDAAAQTILRKAEEYYGAVADRVGYARYKNFWTWEDRVQVIYFADQAAFAKAMGQPPWAKAFSFTHTGNFNLRMIVSFKGQDNFLNTILPHEIGHLVMHDLMGGGRIPLWFDEGVAQLNEERVDEQYRPVMARLAEMGKVVPFALLDGYTLKGQTDAMQVTIFYAESLYIVDFLIKTYGNDAFRELCRLLRDGRTFEEALKVAYYPTLDSMAVFEDKWVKYMAQSIH